MKHTERSWPELPRAMRLRDPSAEIWNKISRSRSSALSIRFGATPNSQPTYIASHNCGIDRIRKRRETPIDPTTVELCSGSDTPEEAMVARRQKEKLASALRNLPLSLRQPMVLRLEGLTYGEIAEIIDISVSNVGVRIHRATAALKRELNP